MTTDKQWDVLVIGGGIAGASVAYELAGVADVLLVDMESTLGHHATGRSAAMFLETYGGADVRAFTMASREFLESPPAEFESQLLRSRPLMQVARMGRGHVVKEVFADVSGIVGDVELVDEARARDLCPIVRSGVIEAGLYEPSAMEMDVDALHQGFVRGFRGRGGSVRRGCRVEQIERVGDRWTVSLGDGSWVSATTVVNAAGAWADHVAAVAGVRPLGFVPRRRTAFTTAAPEDVALERLPMLYDVDESFYVKPEGDQMLCSPADKTISKPVDARPDTLEIARSLDEIREVTTIPARSVRTSWAGLRTFSPDENLVVGADPDVAGFFWLAGQAGYGVQTSPALARFAAAAIVGDEQPKDVLTLGLQPDRVSPSRFGQMSGADL
ncbi:FAD-dependent oxidoreductase [Aeromicrobium panaciterrae]|uniref:NAD(P)/FAD-dependent oxidoreductase n=1 Tax=Aeromicrobium panaciterrae TaxID=363861 RepID=UPI0031E31D55